MRFPHFFSSPAWQFPVEIKSSLLGSYLFSVVQTLALLSVFFRLPPIVPLWYTLANPGEQLANKEWLLLIPALSICVSVLHTALAPLLYEHGSVLIRLFGWATLTVQLIFTLSLLRIILILM
jgi:hypothetical protein